jgi:hypothetical protein
MDHDDSDRTRSEDERRREREERERLRAERQRAREAWRAERQRSREEWRAGRKERVLHTRISDRLAGDIRMVADELRVPVSNLVRNVLEDVFSVVEVVTDNVGDLVEEVVDEADRVAERLARRTRSTVRDAREFDDGRRRDETARDPELEADGPEAGAPPPARPDLPEFPDVLGWQPLVLNATQTCACCGRGLARGDRAFLGLGSSGPGTKFLCRFCAP